MQTASIAPSGLGGHPPGLRTLFFTEMWERFSYYGMRALLILYMTASTAAGGLGFAVPKAAAIYGLYTGMVYFTALPGGWVADRLLGQKRAVLIGGVLIALGHFSIATNVLTFFYAGLVLIVLGTGLLKPNISSIVGQLYEPGDPRRDAGFSIFYMGINLGAWISPIVCGFMAQHEAFRRVLASVGIQAEHTWHWGFGAAGVGMTLGLVQYWWGRDRLKGVGELKEAAQNFVAAWMGVVGSLLALGALIWFAWDLRYVMMLLAAVGFFAWLLAQARTPQERTRTVALIILFIFSVLFWAAFEQAGSSLNLFAEHRTRLSFLGFDFPASWLQSINAMFIWMLAPVFAWIWVRLGPREPSSPAKFALGLFFVGFGFLPVALASYLSESSGGGLVSPLWLVLLYLFHTIGELCLSPVGLSTVTKLAPERLVGSMMGVWFLALSLGNVLGGWAAGFFQVLPLPQLFGAVAATTIVSGLLLAFLVQPIKRLMGGVH
jgi:proton-dependent oligopeptide transporter, POT family